MYKTIRLFSIRSLLLLFPAISFAQTIDIQLPFYAGREYYVCLLKGTRQDTIVTGKLNTHGKTTINLPENYRGVSRFSVRESDKMWNIVISGNEHIRMSVPVPSGSLEREKAKPVFEGSPENSFLLNSLDRQNRIIQDYINIVNAQDQSLVLALPEVRLSVLENEYKAFRREINESPFYAARLVEILNFLSGVGSSFIVSKEDMLEEQRLFIVKDIDFNDLYTSGFWQQSFELWCQIATIHYTDSLLLNDSRYMLDRCGNDIPIRRELTQTIIRLFTKYAKDSLLVELGTEYLTMPLNGQLAPQIVTNEGSFLPKNSLIVFYETGCGNCHYEMEQLKGKYKLLTDNNIRVVSIAADLEKEVFDETSVKLPWIDKLCDFKGFDGGNFKNYGIVGTPTYILTDSEGIVRGRYAQLKELIKD